MPLMKFTVTGVAAFALGATLFFSPAEAATPSPLSTGAASAALVKAVGALSLENASSLFAFNVQHGGSRDSGRGSHSGGRSGGHSSGGRSSGHDSGRRSSGGRSSGNDSGRRSSGDRRGSSYQSQDRSRSSDSRRSSGQSDRRQSSGSDSRRSSYTRRDSGSDRQRSSGRSNDRRDTHADTRRSSGRYDQHRDSRSSSYRSRSDNHRSYSREPSHGYGRRSGHGYYDYDRRRYVYYQGYDPYGWVFAVHVGYYPPYGCRTVERVVYRGYRRVVYGAVQCIDEWGYPYIVAGSQYVYRTY